MTVAFQHLRPVLAFFIGQRRNALLGGALLAAVTVLAGVALLGLSGWFITATAIAGLSSATALAFDVFAPSAGIRLLALGRTASRYGERLVTHDVTLRLLAGLRERLFRGWAGPGAAHQLLRRPARLLFRLTADIDALDSLYLRVLVPMAAALGTAAVVALVLALLHPALGFGAGAWLLLAGLGLPILAAHRALAPARRRAHASEALLARAIDLVAGQTELVMAGRLAAQCAALAGADRRQAESDDALNRIETGVGIGFGLASAVLLSGTLLAVTALAEAGRIGAPAAALGVLVALAALEPFAGLRRGALELGRTLFAARRIGPRLAPTEAAPVSAPPSIPGVAAWLDGVVVRHDGAARSSLTGISLSLQVAETVAIVGPSGAGKSTLLSVIAGEIGLTAGHVEALPATLLTQRSELFQDSLRDNLRLADPAANDAQLMAALASAGLRADVEALPLGLETRLGENGLGLSGGQARRLTLARLVLRDTPLWLLDEPTEGLDGATARDVMARLRDCAQRRCVVIATHVRREAEAADRLIVMEHGQIVATARRGEAGFAVVLAGLRPD
ncbi:MAG TPA: amino acid ABC transporter ATP-binding/permease protein [Bosea sp. (in: a-proteobacteria)]|jgi:ATP-binding cassette subfamily C protein CydC|uniref:amino acid ABC transporter ATP-binding/permease protein n=1 Tax=Bosea sp. (in: a-proteobacteria) TaxID=1871050 RepID=UPI002E0F0F95|nr:amino acid ABC transporter ATP-binding/permease protein [Bosea sp. (in: a-proteobacteria)]